jgi:hypothetical protein
MTVAMHTFLKVNSGYFGVTFPGIRDCVRELLRVGMDALAPKFHGTHDTAVSDEIERVLKEYGKLREP